MIELLKKTQDLICWTLRIVYFLRQQNYAKAYTYENLVFCTLQEYFMALPEEICQKFQLILNMILDSKEGQDKVKMADIYQWEFLPLLYQVLTNLLGTENMLMDNWEANQEVLQERFPEVYKKVLECKDEIPDEYFVSMAMDGGVSLEIETKAYGKVRMHSAYTPDQEALLFAENYKDAEECIVLGFGMGHHIETLLENPLCKKITVLENDIYQLAVAFSFAWWEQMLRDERLAIVYCEDSKEYLKHLSNIKKDTRICIWHPSVQTIQDNSLRERLEELEIELSSIKNMEIILKNNFEINIEKKDREVSCLREKFRGKKVLFLAAGPSLDKGIEWIQKNDISEYMLICVGKVASKLLKTGIRPDFIVMTDALERTRWQINNIEECGVPLIYLSTVASKVVKDYVSERYIAFQEGFGMAEEYAKKNGYSLYQTGGSVATFALDLLLQFGCSRIICLGLDMGYTGDQTHAGGIGSQIADKQNLRQVEGIQSKYIYTNKTLDIYRKWIEKRIKGIEDVELINVSGGARIHGMKEAELKDILLGNKISFL